MAPDTNNCKIKIQDLQWNIYASLQNTENDYVSTCINLISKLYSIKTVIWNNNEIAASSILDRQKDLSIQIVSAYKSGSTGFSVN